MLIEDEPCALARGLARAVKLIKRSHRGDGMMQELRLSEVFDLAMDEAERSREELAMEAERPPTSWQKLVAKSAQ